MLPKDEAGDPPRPQKPIRGHRRRWLAGWPICTSAPPKPSARRSSRGSGVTNVSSLLRTVLIHRPTKARQLGPPEVVEVEVEAVVKTASALYARVRRRHRSAGTVSRSRVPPACGWRRAASVYGAC